VSNDCDEPLPGTGKTRKKDTDRNGRNLKKKQIEERKRKMRGRMERKGLKIYWITFILLVENSCHVQ